MRYHANLTYLVRTALCLLAAVAACALPAAGHAQTPAIAVLEKVQAENASIDAEIRKTEKALSGLELKVVKLQQQANSIDAAAARYDRSTEVRREKKNYDDYQRTCAGKRLYGSQIGACNRWASKLQVVLANHNRTMINFRVRYEAAKRKVQQAKNNVVLARARIQKLKNYKSWINNANIKIAQDLLGQCKLAAGASMEEMKHRCGNIQFDRARVNLPPCQDARCRTWDAMHR